MKMKIKKPGFLVNMNKRQFLYGGYSVAVMAVVVALVIGLNLLLTFLDTKVDMKVDLSQSRTYSISTASVNTLAELKQDIMIYIFNSSDPLVEEILKKYQAQSDHIKIEYRDINANPAFANKFSQGSSSGVTANDIVVSNAGQTRFKLLNKYQRYRYDANTGYATQVIVEENITNAINYITKDVLTNVFFLQGHGEPAITANTTLGGYISGLGYNVSTITLKGLTDETLSNGDILMVIAPTVDLDEGEREIIKNYITRGGRLFFAFDPTTGPLPYFDSLMDLYGMKLERGMVVENNRNYYVAPYPNFLIPAMASHDITNSILTSRIPSLLQVSGAITLPTDYPQASMEILPILASSSDSYLTTDLTSETPQQKLGDLTGPFVLGAVATIRDPANSANNVRFVVFNSSNLVLTAENLGQYSNLDLFTNCISWLTDDADIFVRGKLINSSQLYFANASETYAVILLTWPVLALVIFAAGMVMYLRRKHL